MLHLFKVGLAALAVALASQCSGQAISEENPQPARASESAIAKWRAQQEKVASVKVELTGDQRLNGVAPSQPRHGHALFGELGLRDAHRLSVLIRRNDGSCRIETDAATLNATREMLSHGERVSTFGGGGHSRALMSGYSYVMDVGTVFPPQTLNQEVETIAYKPIFLAFRPFDEKFLGVATVDKYAIDRNDRHAMSRETPLGSMRLSFRNLEIRLKKYPEGFALYLYLVKKSSGRPRATVYVKQVKWDSGVWVPMEWSCTYYDDNGAISNSHELRMVDYSLNPKFGDKDFQLEFKEGTLVARIGETKDVHWYVGQGGVRRPLNRDEFHKASALGIESLGPSFLVEEKEINKN